MFPSLANIQVRDLFLFCWNLFLLESLLEFISLAVWEALSVGISFDIFRQQESRSTPFSNVTMLIRPPVILPPILETNLSSEHVLLYPFTLVR